MAFKRKAEIIKGIIKEIHCSLRMAVSGFNWKDKNNIKYCISYKTNQLQLIPFIL